MAFRYRGRNWEGRLWFTVPAVTTLGKQIEQARPGTYATDGTVASKAHDLASPNSDHRPDESGAVRAIDAGGTPEFLGFLTGDLAAGRDPRLSYMIYNGRILRSYRRLWRLPWQWYKYTGASPHEKHAHISVVSSMVGYDGRPWALPSLEQEEELVIGPGATGNTVSKIQKAINGVVDVFGGDKLAVDGQYGPATEAAVKGFQSSADSPDTGTVDGITMALLMEFVPDWVDNHTEVSGVIIDGSSVIVEGTIKATEEN